MSIEMSPVDRYHIATDTDSDALFVVFQFLQRGRK